MNSFQSKNVDRQLFSTDKTKILNFNVVFNYFNFNVIFIYFICGFILLPVLLLHSLHWGHPNVWSPLSLFMLYNSRQLIFFDWIDSWHFKIYLNETAEEELFSRMRKSYFPEWSRRDDE